MKFGLVIAKDNKKAQAIGKLAQSYILEKGHQVFAQDNLSEAEIIIALGGDGTLIHTACKYAPLNVPFLGINVGTLGFLTAREDIHWQMAIDEILQGKHFVSERITIEASFDEQNFRAVNEVVVKGAYRVVDLEIDLDSSRFLEIVGDGVIISTQTGSTAYSLSAGGPIVDPNLDCLLMTPVNSIGLPIPSVVLSPNDTVDIKVIKGEDISFIADGHEHVKVKKGQIVKVTKGKYKVKFVYFDEHQFVKSLEAKFGLKSRMVKR